MKFRAIALVLMVSGAAHAQDSAGAETLYAAGAEAWKRGDFTTACQKFAASQKLDKSYTTLIRIGDCEEKEGKLADAWTHYLEARDGLTSADPKDTQIAAAKTRIAKVERRIPKLTVKLAAGAPSDTKVTRDEVELPAGSIGEAMPVNVGEHIVVASAPGRKSTTQRISVAEGKSVTVEVMPGEVEVVAAPLVTSSQSKDATKEKPDAAEKPPAAAGSSKTLGYVVGGVGVAGLVVAGVSFAMVKSNQGKIPASCDTSSRECAPSDVGAANDSATSAKGWTTPFYAGLAVGLIGVGVGGYLLLSNKTGDVGLGVTPTGANLRGRF
jgi:hypothetical protein